MSDENEQKPNLKVLEFHSKKEKQAEEGNKLIADMFKSLSERAAAGDIDDFVITFKSRSRGHESMVGIGDGISKFDFMGYVGMLEVLKTRLISIMSQMSYSYPYEPTKSKPQTNEPEPINEQKPTDPEKTDV